MVFWWKKHKGSIDWTVSITKRKRIICLALLYAALSITLFSAKASVDHSYFENLEGMETVYNDETSMLTVKPVYDDIREFRSRFSILYPRIVSVDAGNGEITLIVLDLLTGGQFAYNGTERINVVMTGPNAPRGTQYRFSGLDVEKNRSEHFYEESLTIALGEVGLEMIRDILTAPGPVWLVFESAGGGGPFVELNDRHISAFQTLYDAYSMSGALEQSDLQLIDMMYSATIVRPAE